MFEEVFTENFIDQELVRDMLSECNKENGYDEEEQGEMKGGGIMVKWYVNMGEV